MEDRVNSFLSPFSLRDTDFGLCVMPEGIPRRSGRPVDVSVSHMREGAVHCMSLSPDHKLCAVAGGNTITVFTTNPLARTLAYKKPSHSYSITDVVWSPHVNDQKIVMSAANGTLTVFDPHAFEQASQKDADKYKKDMNVSDQRIIRRLAWHPYHPDLILAGKYDGCSEIIDLRQYSSWSYPSKDSFSVRKSMHQVTDVTFCPVPAQQPQPAMTDENNLVFGSGSSSEFSSLTSGSTSVVSGGSSSPVTYDQNVFMSAHNNGSLSLWDWRKPQFPIMTVSAHPSTQAVIMRMEWHPLGLYLATCGVGGVKLWSVNPASGPSSSGTSGINLVQWIKSVNSVSYVHWRPQFNGSESSVSSTSSSYSYQIASCPQCNETFVSLWDFRNTNIARAYVGDFVPDSPLASLQTASTINNFLWLDPDTIIATHAGGKLRINSLSTNVKIPFRAIRPVSFAMDASGVVTSTMCRFNRNNPLSNRVLSYAPQEFPKPGGDTKLTGVSVTPLSSPPLTASLGVSGGHPEPSAGIKIVRQVSALGSSSPMPSPRNMNFPRKTISSFPQSSSSGGTDSSGSSSASSSQSKNGQSPRTRPWLSRASSATEYLMNLYRSSSSVMTKASEDYVFKEMARRCLLAPFGEIKDKWMVCRYNARVSEELGCPHYAQLWTLAQHAFQPRDFESYDDEQNKNKKPNALSGHTLDFFPLWMSPADSSVHSSSSRGFSAFNSGSTNIFGGMLSSTEHQEEPDEDVKAFSVLFSSHQDEFIPMEDETVQPMGMIPAFTLESLCQNCKTEDVAEAPTTVSIENARDYERQSALFQQMVCEIIHMYSEIGFFQICALLFLVLGDILISQKSLTAIGSRTILCYIHALQRMKLYLEASAAIRQCPQSCCLKSLDCDKRFLRELNRENTTFDFTNPSSRKKPRCCVCGLKVSGLSVWCPGCGHGGHIEHIRAWLQHDSRCPSGCPHMCSFTTSTM